MFIGRDEELKEIKNALKSNKLETILIYGRRRVGKSEIIKQALINTKLPVVSFECKRASSRTNLDSLSKLFSDIFSLSNLKFETYDDFFEYVFKYSLTKEFVLVIDEFSFLLNDDFSIESALAIAIDKFKSESKLKLIISGSYVSLMTNMLEYGSHCYGRFNHFLLIRSFDYYTSSLFYFIRY